MDPAGRITSGIFDPLTARGTDGYTITKGWMAQLIIPPNTTLELIDYWWPRGYCSEVSSGDTLYGDEAEQEVDEGDVPEEFKRVRRALSIKIDNLAQERIEQIVKRKK